MKIRKVAGLSLVGMVLTSLTVYGITDPTALAAPAADGVGAAVENLTGADKLAPEGFAKFTSDGTLSVEARLGHGHLRPGVQRSFVTVEVRGNQATAVKRPPVHMSLVIDKSGSMKGSRIDNAIKSARAVVANLSDGDTVSVVAFDTQVEEVVLPTRLDATNRASVADRINNIRLGGDTCISCGVDRAMQHLRSAGNGLRRAIVLSDGAANNGVRDVAGFQSIARMCRGQDVAVSTIGVGVDYNERILSALALESNGLHHFVENDASLQQVLEAETRTAINTIATGSEAQIKLAPGVRLINVFARAHSRQGDRINVPLGTFAPGETKTVLMEIEVDKRAAGTSNVADVWLNYNDLAKDGPVTAHGALATIVGDKTDVLDPFVATRLERARTSAALAEANALAAGGDFSGAQRALNDRLTRLRGAAKQAKRTARRRSDARNGFINDKFDEELDFTEKAARNFSKPMPKPAAKAAVRDNQTEIFARDL